MRFSVLADFVCGFAVLDEIFFGFAVSSIPECPPPLEILRRHTECTYDFPRKNSFKHEKLLNFHIHGNILFGVQKVSLSVWNYLLFQDLSKYKQFICQTLLR